MNGTGPTGGKVELPLIDILVNAFKYVYDERRDFIALASLPVVGLSLISVGLDVLLPQGGVEVNEQGLPVSVGPGFFAHFAVTTIFFTMFAVAWYRKFLVGEEDITVATALKWDGRKLRFLARFVGLILLIALVMLPVTLGLSLISATGLALGPIAFIVMLAVALLAYARGALWLTAGCVDDPVSLRDIWLATRGNSWRLASLTIAPALIVGLVQSMLLSLLLTAFSAMGLAVSLSAGLVINLVAETMSYISIAVVASAVSMAYLRFKASWS